MLKLEGCLSPLFIGLAFPRRLSEIMIEDISDVLLALCPNPKIISLFLTFCGFFEDSFIGDE
jgi:hypothetical protein